MKKPKKPRKVTQAHLDRAQRWLDMDFSRDWERWSVFHRPTSRGDQKPWA